MVDFCTILQLSGRLYVAGLLSNVTHSHLISFVGFILPLFLQALQHHPISLLADLELPISHYESATRDRQNLKLLEASSTFAEHCDDGSIRRCIPTFRVTPDHSNCFLDRRRLPIPSWKFASVYIILLPKHPAQQHYSSSTRHPSKTGHTFSFHLSSSALHH